MRSATILGSDKQGIFDTLMSIAKAMSFDVLYADRIHLEIEAMKSAKLGRKKHLSFRMIELRGNCIDIEITVRNLGLELRRNKSNDMLELQLERSLLQHIRASTAAFSAA